jgi:hypothetical protein
VPGPSAWPHPFPARCLRDTLKAAAAALRMPHPQAAHAALPCQSKAARLGKGGGPEDPPSGPTRARRTACSLACARSMPAAVRRCCRCRSARSVLKRDRARGPDAASNQAAGGCPLDALQAAASPGAAAPVAATASGPGGSSPGSWLESSAAASCGQGVRAPPPCGSDATASLPLPALESVREGALVWVWGVDETALVVFRFSVTAFARTVAQPLADSA